MAREKFRLKDQKVLSYGPCQTPTLWFCVQRHKEIQNFRSSEYYYVSAKINILGRGVVEFLWADGDSVQSREELNAMEHAVRTASQSGAGAVICGNFFYKFYDSSSMGFPQDIFDSFILSKDQN